MGVEHLGLLDSSFVVIEREGLPMHVGGLAVLDSGKRTRGPIQPAELRRRLRGRVRELSRLRVRLAPGLRRPAWVPDAEFDVGRHLEHWTLAPDGGWPGLLQVVGDLHARLLPRDRPLWRVSLIDGLPGGRQAVLTTTHHSITDGIAGVELTQALFDRPARSTAAPAPRADGFFGSGGGRDGLTRALQAAAGVARYVAGGPIAVPGPFNGPVGARRAVATASLRLEHAVAIKRRLGGSVDDVVLASVALAVGARLERTDQLSEGLRLRAMVPVSTLAGGSGGLGNHVTAMFLDLPVDLPPVRCLHEIAAAKAMHRAWHEPLGLQAALRMAGAAPSALATPVTVLLCALPVANLVVSDVPGPSQPMSLLSAPMVGAYPLMPLSASIGLSIAVVTIGGVMGVGVTTDPDLVPDGEALTQDIERAFAALLHAVP